MRAPVPFDKYLLIDRISVGGMAEVFKAKLLGVEGFEKFVAIKRILPSSSQDQEFITMFVDEAKICSQLSHAGIVQVYELGCVGGSHFIAMEYVAGKDLLQVQNLVRERRTTIPVQMAAYIIAQVCDALDYAHRRADSSGRPLHIIHRDVSPQNVLINYDGEVKVVDFGIAKATLRTTKTEMGILKGKLGYMSPEQVRGLPIDHRSDIFAIGTLLHELLTAERLFHAESDLETLERVRNVRTVAPSKINPSVPLALDRITLRALAKNVEDRYQHASEIQDDLRSFLSTGTLPFGAQELAAWMRTHFTAATPEDPFAERTEVSPPNFAARTLVDDTEEVSTDPLPRRKAEQARPKTIEAEPSTSLYGTPSPVHPPIAAAKDAPPRVQTVVHGELKRRDRGTGQTGATARTALAGRDVLLGMALAALVVLTATTARNLFWPPAATVVISPAIAGELIVDRLWRAHLEPGRLVTLSDLAAGRHDFVVKRQDGDSAAETVKLRSGEVLELYSSAAAREDVGQGRLHLHMSGAAAPTRVLLDGADLGENALQAPIVLRAGTPHELRVSRPLYAERRITVEVTAGQELTKDVALEPAVARVNLTTRPSGADVWVDGTLAGQSPLLLEGIDARKTLKITFRHPGYAPLIRTVSFEKSIDRNVEFEMARGAGKSHIETPNHTVATANAPGYLLPYSQPWARVWIDGKDTGQTTPVAPRNHFGLAPGRHLVTFVVAGKRYDFPVAIEAGKETRLSKQLP